jgi:site-specific DNA-methyltransferase (adenine-specific)
MSQAIQRETVEQHREEISHRIYGSTAESMHDLDDESVHLIVTSPPYWNIKDYGQDNQIGYQDSLADYLERLKAVWQECYRVLKPGCRMVINIGDQYHRAQDGRPYQITPLNAHVINSVLDSTSREMLFLGNIIWQKISNTETSGGASVMGSYGRPRNGYVSYDYEYISIFRKPGDDPKVPGEIIDADEITLEEWRELFAGHWNFTGEDQENHPAPFPEELPRRILRMFSFSGDVVLDPFLGSGTTTKVADEMNRSSVGYEIGFDSPSEKQWQEVIKEKIGYYDVDEPARSQRFELDF